MSATVTKLELGCGLNKREGFFGVDILPSPCVDLILNIEDNIWPFEDNQMDYIYSSHAFEHMKNFVHIFKEMHRVCKPGATIEIWTPYGKSNDGFLFGHYQFFTETHWKHVCYEYDRHYLGSNLGFFNWEKTEYLCFPNIIEELKKMKIGLDFALNHMFNIALEMGVFLRVDKTRPEAERPQIPQRFAGYKRGDYIVKF